MEIWPPDYTELFKKRAAVFSTIEGDPVLQEGSLFYYQDKPEEFINDWCITYDPRNVSQNLPSIIPFSLFKKQRDLVRFLFHCLYDEASGLIEKSRDMGATWVCVGFSVWAFLFLPGSAIGWGSRKEQLVDKLGDPDSIFEKIRMMLDYLPFWFLPKAFDPQKHCSYMRIVNPETKSTITGEAGDNIGRGGRKLIYFKDESAHYERPDKIEAALGDNTNVQIDISSVNGTGNVFERRRKSGVIYDGRTEIPKGITRVFVMDWRDHPAKDQAWYDKRKEKAEREGLTHNFSQEVDRDYSAAISGVVIPSLWVKTAIDAHKKLGFNDEGLGLSALDVADGGTDKNAHAFRKGVILKHVESWSDIVEDVGETTLKCVNDAQMLGASELHYDCIGVGSGVRSETNRLIREGLLTEEDLEIVPWNAAESPLNPDDYVIHEDDRTPTNRDFFANLKAQGWWELRLRFERTYKMIHKGIVFPFSELISIPSDLENLHEITGQLSQATYTTNGRRQIVIDKTPKGTKSPNEADAIMMVYWPAEPERLFVGVI